MSFHIFCVESGLYQLLTYIMKMWSENFSSFTFYGIVWKGAGNEIHEHTQMSCGLVVDDVEKDSDMNKDDDLVSILSQ